MKKKREHSRRKMSGQELGYQIVINGIMALVLLACVVPFLYVVGMSLSSKGEMIDRNFFILFPRKPILEAYTYVMRNSGFWHGLLVTVLRTALGVPASLVFPVILGYILSKKDIPFRKPMMLYLLITMLLGGGLIPGYLLMRDLHLLNSFWVYVIPAFGNIYGILVVKMFVEELPLDLLESAELDGASEMQKLVYIAMPLLKPTLCALGLFSAVGQWNDWFSALIYVRNPELFPVQLIIRNLFNQSIVPDPTKMNTSYYATFTPESVKMASVVLAVLPILGVYPFLQKYFIYGMYTGAVKG